MSCEALRTARRRKRAVAGIEDSLRIVGIPKLNDPNGKGLTQGVVEYITKFVSHYGEELGCGQRLLALQQFQAIPAK
jgi:hypothetical protein